MKNFNWLILSWLFVPNLYADTFDWGNLKKDRIELKLPLLTIQGEKGLLACGYVNVSTCNKTGEACAIVSGVNQHDDMLYKPVLAVSEEAIKLGIQIGMPGADALELLR